MRGSAQRKSGHLTSRAWGAHIPGGSSTEVQRSQTAFCANTLRAAGLLSVDCVGSALAARCGDARSLAALSTAKIPRRSAPCNFQTGS